MCMSEAFWKLQLQIKAFLFFFCSADHNLVALVVRIIFWSFRSCHELQLQEGNKLEERCLLWRMWTCLHSTPLAKYIQRIAAKAPLSLDMLSVLPSQATALTAVQQGLVGEQEEVQSTSFYSANVKTHLGEGGGVLGLRAEDEGAGEGGEKKKIICWDVIVEGLGICGILVEDQVWQINQRWIEPKGLLVLSFYPLLFTGKRSEWWIRLSLFLLTHQIIRPMNWLFSKVSRLFYIVCVEFSSKQGLQTSVWHDLSLKQFLFTCFTKSLTHG